MAHFAKLNNDNIVIDVQSVHNDTATDEAAGITFLNNLYGTSDTWKQTSYNTKGGVHLLGGTPFRKNYAGIGYSYDSSRDAFIPPKPYPSWLLEESSCMWKAPIDHPDDGEMYVWDEDNQEWDKVS